MSNKLKLFKRTKGKIRLCALSLAGFIAVNGLVGCDSNNKDKNKDIYNSTVEQNQGFNKTFDIGEHIISIPIENPTTCNRKYEYHQGYKCVGFATSSYGEYVGFFDGACALYVNEYPVKCSSLEENLYNSFGEPLEYDKKISKEENGRIEYEPGEHIISIPLNFEPTSGNIQYENHPGYEPIDITTSSYGKYVGFFDGGAIMYVNTSPVSCIKNSNSNDFTDFGIPIEKEKTIKK